MNYANFWQRFCANLLDVLVVLPFAWLQSWLGTYSKLIAMILVIPLVAAYSAYIIYCHGRFGRTLGKYVMRIRVQDVFGGQISWRQAWLRSSVDVGFSTISVISSLIALIAISDANYYGVTHLQRAQNLQALEPSWLAWTSVAAQLWFWSEVVVMLFNRQRRALHDFIAGTVVIAEPKGAPVQAQNA